MLANCHRDLAQSPKADKLKAQEHREHMRRWVQRALGTQSEERAGAEVGSFAVPYDSFNRLSAAADSNWSIKAEYGSYKKGSGSGGDKIPPVPSFNNSCNSNAIDNDRELNSSRCHWRS